MPSTPGTHPLMHAEPAFTMKSGFVRVSTPMADPDPPQPIPFPIKIVNDVPPPPSEDGGIAVDSGPSGNRTDYFYAAWDKFLALEPKRAKRISRAARKLEEEKNEVAETPGDGKKVEENASLSWEHAAAECRAKVAAIVDECKRLNQKYRDALFDLEASPYCLQGLTGRYPKAVDKIDAPPWIKRVEDIFDNPQFYIDGATAQDVHQGSGGDCWFLAALMAVSAKKELIEALCVARDEKIGVYGFVFYRDGEWVYEVIDDKLFLRVGDDDDLNVVRDWDKDKKEGMPLKHDEDKLLNQLQRGGEALYFSHCKSNETWLPLIEKAYAKAHGDYASIEGGFASEAIEDLTGGVGVVINPEDIMDKDRFWREQLIQVNKKYLFGGGSKPTATKGFVGGHAYAVLEAWEEGDLRLLKLRNPWGETEWEGDWSDGSKLWTPEMMIKLKHTFGDDGVFWISYKDFLKHFPSINRVRLFNKDWQVAQRWTSVNVPWTVDYLDTKFQFTITEKCPVVIVLTQPDDRYFYGLRGRYLFSLHFRVYKEGDEDGRWIVRSMHNSGNETIFTRSVSAEIEDLEPGTYNVVFKVTAVRSKVSPTAEEAIMKFAVDRKDKLLHVGRRFDYAQSKGNLKAMEEANKKQRYQDRRDMMKDSYKKERRINQKELERARKRKKRINDAMNEKKKEFNEKQREEARARRERMAARRREQREEAQNATQDEPQVEEAGEDKSDSKPSLTPETEESPAALEVEVKAEETPGEAAAGASDTGPVQAAETQNVPAEGDDSQRDPSAESSRAQDVSKPNEGRTGDEQEDLSKGISELRLDEARRGSGGPFSPMEEEEHDDEYDSPVEPPEELEDDDFEWDSDMDGPGSISSDNDEQGRRVSALGSKNEIFADDPWNAMCVLGLRVYSLNANAKIRVVKDDDNL